MTSSLKTMLSPPHGSSVNIHWTNKKTPNYIPISTPENREKYVGSSAVQQELFLGENLEILGHLLDTRRGSFQLIYADPPFDSIASYKKSIRPLGNKSLRFYQEQYNDHWMQGEYEQFLFERFLVFRDLLSDDGSLYVHCDWHSGHIIRMILDEVFGRENFRNEIIWHHDFGGRGKRFLARKHDNLFLYTKGKQWFFDHDSLPLLPYKGNLHKYRGAQKKGKKPTAVWSDVKGFSGQDEVWDIAYENKMSVKNTGYPTQKPQALLERIISLSCPPGGNILDPFIGSGTTMRAAQSSGRNCVGIDSNNDAIETTRNSLLRQFPDANLAISTTHTHGSPPSERFAQKKICTTQHYTLNSNNTAIAKNKESVIFAPLCRPCTQQDMEQIKIKYEYLLLKHQHTYLWGHSFEASTEYLASWKREYNISICSTILVPGFHIEWKQQNKECIVLDIPLPTIRNQLGADKSIVWQQLISSIRVQSAQKSDTIYIGTAQNWVPHTIPLPATPCTITFTDILSRSVRLYIPSSTP